MHPFQQALYSSVDSRVLELILFPTEQCNFRCTYCYEDFKLGRMSPPVVSGLKALLRHRFERLQLLTISWFGGEPLLALGLVEEVSEYILTLTRLHSHVVYTAGMTTNGYLLSPSTFTRLVGLGINRFQVSLDGDCEAHDSTRRRLGGGGSFGRIWDNLLAVRDSSIAADVLLRVHLTSANFASVEALIRRIRTEFSRDGRFRVLLKPIGRLGGPHDESLPVLPREQTDEVVVHLGQILGSDVRLANEDLKTEQAICYASKANSLAIRSDGSVAKCTVALSDPRNRVGQLSEDGKITFDRGRLNSWLRGLETLDQEDLSCPYKGLPGDPAATPAHPSLVELRPRWAT